MALRGGLDCIYKFNLKVPKFELYATGSQIRRASKPASANIAEGYGRRRYQANYVKFLVYAQASCDEANELLAYIADLYEDLNAEGQPLLDEIDGLGRQINSLIESVEARS